jgi:hypothetical protein
LGPHKILQLKGDSNLEIQLKHNNRKTVVHANRFKPYFVASKNSAVFPENFESNITPKQHVQEPPDDQNFPEPKDYSDTVRQLLQMYAEVASTQPSPAIISPRNNTHKSLSSHTKLLSEDFAPPSSRTRSRVHAQNNKGQLIFLQITSDPLHIFERGEGLENEINGQEEISIIFINGDNSWILVKKKKCKNIDNK